MRYDWGSLFRDGVCGGSFTQCNGFVSLGELKLTLSSYIGGYLLGLALFDEAPCWSVHLFELDPALVKELISDCNIHCSALI